MPAKYDTIGIDYDATRKADPLLASKLLAHLSPKKDGRYLDIGCGTGNYTHAMQLKGFRFIGIDPSREMLEKAKRRNGDIDWLLGSVENITLPDNSIDGIVASLTMHHWHDLQAGFCELSRVLKPGGRIVIFTSTPDQMRGYWLNEYFPKMMADSTEQMPGFKHVEEALNACGIKIVTTEKYFVQPDLQDQFLQCGKHNPELYFDPRIRKGISSFAALANQNEVERGLRALRRDIDSGKIRAVMASYENETGDYLYIVGETNSNDY